MITYILHVTVITTICFLFYKLLLQKETFYQLNRWILMGCLAVSFGLPLLPVPRELSWRDKWEELTVRQDAQQADRQDAQQVSGKDAKRALASAGTKALPKTADEWPPTVNVLATGATGKTDGRVAPTGDEHKGAVRHKTTHSRTAGNRKASSPGPQNGMASSSGPQNGMASWSTPQNGRPTQMDLPSSRVSETGGSLHDNKSVRRPAAENGAGQEAPLLFLVVKWVFFGYLFGLLLFGANFLLQIAVLLYQSYSRPVIQDGRFRIVEIRGNRAPCSFGNTIFINPENYDWETYNQILIHEKIHVSGRHTLDILLAEIAVVLQWFNPFVWLYRREVENNLEFLTDASVLMHREVERSAYQLSLLRVSAPHLPFSITNNYNQSLLKRRIVMMNSKRSSFHTVWKYFFLLPILSVLVCALNKPAAFAAEDKTTSPGHSILPGANTVADGSSARPVSPLKLPTLLAIGSSAIGDTSIRPASGNGSAHDGSAQRDTLRYDRTSDDDDNPMLKAQYLSQAEAAYLDQLNVKLASAQQASVQLQLKDRQLTATNVQMAMMDQDMQRIRSQVSMNLNIQPMVYPDINLHMDIMADTDLREGAWFATSSDDKLSFELKSGDDDHNWSSSLHVDKSEINPFPGQGNVEFKLVREAGTMTFKGQFDGQEGFGHFRFTPDEGYLSAIKQMGVQDIDDRREFAYFTVNIKKEYVDMLVHNGFPHISQRDLISFAAMKIDKDFIQDWRGSGFDDADNPRNLISLKAMKIDRAYVNELKAAGYDHLNVHELISMKAQHIDRSYIRSLGRNGDSPIPVRELISYKAMHIDSGYLDALRKLGYDNLPRNEVTSLYAMHITPEYIKSLQELGFKDIPARELTSLKGMSITPEYIKGFQDIGFKDISARQLTSFKAMNITPDFIKGFRDLGYGELSPGELSSLKSMNITPDFVAAFNKIGFDHIPVHMLTSLKAMGVNADYVLKMREKGFNSNDLNKYIRLKNDFN